MCKEEAIAILSSGPLAFERCCEDVWDPIVAVEDLDGNYGLRCRALAAVFGLPCRCSVRSTAWPASLPPSLPSPVHQTCDLSPWPTHIKGSKWNSGLRLSVLLGGGVWSQHCNPYYWKGMCLNAMGYHHPTVNHQQHDVDPVTGARTHARTQEIERSWLDANTMILKRMRGVGRHLFQSHLDHLCWKVMRKKSNDISVLFLEDVRSVYC